ncbi:MAG: DUF4998 domain-containing protein [Bacteroidales bacterium]|nr:DUF4998 domain-containing protein [Bacteroidales bacterium]
MKTLKTICILFIALFFANCGDMDDNYKDYLTNVKVYSPRVTNLTVVSGLKEATLSWKNPQGKIAVKNSIKLQDSIIVLEGLTETYKLTNLEIKGYEVSVYTIDKFDNYSVPATITIFPNGE